MPSAYFFNFNCMVFPCWKKSDKSSTREILVYSEMLWKQRRFVEISTADINQIKLPAGMCLLKVNNRNTRKRCEIVQS